MLEEVADGDNHGGIRVGLPAGAGSAILRENGAEARVTMNSGKAHGLVTMGTRAWVNVRIALRKLKCNGHRGRSGGCEACCHSEDGNDCVSKHGEDNDDKGSKAWVDAAKDKGMTWFE